MCLIVLKKIIKVLHTFKMFFAILENKQAFTVLLISDALLKIGTSAQKWFGLYGQ